MQHYPTDSNSELYRVTCAIEDFGGACDPDFDSEIEEIEYQVAALRFMSNQL